MTNLATRKRSRGSPIGDCVFLSPLLFVKKGTNKSCRPSYFNSTSQPLNSSTYNIVDLYAGERWVSELGLYDLRNRFMSSELGRFLQADPIGFKGDASSLYRYCHNDPENFSDPMGLESAPVPVARPNLTSTGKGDWVFDQRNISYWDELQHRSQPAGNISFAAAAQNEGDKKAAPQGEKDHKDWRNAGLEGGRKAYEKVDKSGLGGPKSHEYGGLIIKHRVNGKWMYNWTGVYRGEQGSVKDRFINSRMSNYLGVDRLPVPEGWTKAGWYYAHPIKGDTIPERDKAVARTMNWVAVGFAPPIGRSPMFPQIEFFPR